MSPLFFSTRVVILAVAIAWSGGCARVVWSPARTTFAAESAQFEFALVDYKPYLVTEDEETYLVDTGTSGVLLSEEAVRRAGAGTRPVRLRATISDGSGRSRVLKRAVRVSGLTLGEVAFYDFIGLVLPRGDMPMNGDDAVLGMGLFSDCAVTFDYPASTMRVEPSVRGSPPPEGAAVLPMRIADGCPYVPIMLGQRRVWALLDTGSGGGIDLPNDFARELTFAHAPAPMFIVRTAWAQRRATYGRLATDVRLGPHVLRRPVVELSPVKPSIGGDVLRHFVVTIDMPNARVLLRRAASEPIESPPLWHCGFVPAPTGADGRYVVYDVIPGTHAQRLGLLVGDSLLTLNGVPFDKLQDSSWSEPSDGDRPVIVEIERGGVRRTHTIYPTQLIP